MRTFGHIFLPLLLVCVCAPAALAKHDYEYAMALARRRFYDLAKVELERLSRSGDQSCRRRAEVGIAWLGVYRARDQRDRSTQLTLLDGSVGKFRKLVAARAEDALRVDLGLVLAERANLSAPDEARRAYRAAIAELQKVVGERHRRQAGYHVLRCKLERALSWPRGTDDRKARLAGLAKDLAAFLWDEETDVAAQLALILQGRQRAGLVAALRPKPAAMADAFASFDLVLKLAVNPHTDGIRSLAYWRYLQICNARGLTDRALSVAARMRREYPRLAETPYGRRAALEEARARQASGHGATDVRGAFLLARQAMADRRWWVAIRRLQGVVAVPEGEGLSLDCWERMAYAFGKLQLPYERYHSLLEASRVAESLGRTDLATRHAVRACRVVRARAYSSRSKSDHGLVRRLRDQILRRFPRSPHSRGLRMDRARDREASGDYRAAIEDYRAQARTEPAALARIAICWVALMRKEEKQAGRVTDTVRDCARRALAAAVGYTGKDRVLRAELVYREAQARAALESHDRLIAATADYSERFGETGARWTAAVLWLRVRARLTQAAAGETAARLKDARGELTELHRAAPRSQADIAGHARLGYAYQQLAATVDPKRAAAHTRTARALLSYWALHAPKIEYGALRAVALGCAASTTASTRARAETLLSRAIREHPQAAAKDRLHDRLAECHESKGRWGAALGLRVRHTLARDPAGPRANLTLGRCYLALAKAPPSEAASVRSLLLDARTEELALCSAVESSFALRELLWRAAELLDEWMAVNQPKRPRGPMRLNNQLRAETRHRQLKVYRKVVDHRYAALLRKLRVTTSADARKEMAAATSRERALACFRRVASRSEKMSDSWWESKLVVMTVHFEGGKVRHARNLMRNLRTLYPSLGGARWKPRFEALRNRILEGR